jgi:hypothetical protein
MTIETQANVTMFGKRDKREPVKATLNGHVLATGQNSTEAKASAMDVLLDGWKWNQEYPEIRFANDGSVFVGRQTAEDRIEYTRYERTPEGKTRTCGASSGRAVIWDERGNERRNVSLSSYMDYIVADYNKVIG